MTSAFETFRATSRSRPRATSAAWRGCARCARAWHRPGPGARAERALPGWQGPTKVQPTSMGHAPSPHVSERLPDHSAQFALRDRLRKLLAVARTHRRALVLTHDNPDPDAVASACRLAFLLPEAAHVHAQPAYGGIIGRAENKALLKVLHLPIQP